MELELLVSLDALCIMAVDTCQVPWYGVKSKRETMTEKALISDLTWRSLEMQRELFKGMPLYELPTDLGAIFRATTRKSEDRFFVASFAIIADSEIDLRDFAKQCKKRKIDICSAEGQTHWRWYNSVQVLVEWWRDARRNGAAKRGGEVKAKKDEILFWQGFNKIKDRWHLPAKKENASPVLLDEAETSRNTVRSYLGYSREEWQKLTQAKRDRILKRGIVCLTNQ